MNSAAATTTTQAKLLDFGGDLEQNSVQNFKVHK